MRDEANKKSVFVQLRQKHGLSQKQVAEALEVSEQTIRNWEHGKTMPQLTILQTKRLCELLQMDLSDLPEWFGPIDLDPRNQQN